MLNLMPVRNIAILQFCVLKDWGQLFKIPVLFSDHPIFKVIIRLK